MKKIVLAYSGGLDTSCIIPWLKENYGGSIIAFCALLGESEDKEELKKRAEDAGADKFYFVDMREEFVRDYVFPALRVGALYEDTYMLATALARPLIGMHLVKIAHENNADAIAHGCTGKGNDQVRFELAAAALDDSMEIIAPVREWEFRSREEELEYLSEKGLVLADTGGGKYSIDRNLWGISIECGELEDPWVSPPKDSYVIVTPAEETPDEPKEITIEFKDGVPVSLDGRSLGGVELIEELNITGGKYGVGRTDMVENRVVGIKSREVYEAPAGEILYKALRALESLVLDKDYVHNKRKLASEYGRLVYEGKWFSPLREGIEAYTDSAKRYLAGEVKVKLYKGSAEVSGRRSPYSLYAEELATYTDKDEFSHKSAKGFIDIWGLPLKVMGKRDKKK